MSEYTADALGEIVNDVLGGEGSEHAAEVAEAPRRDSSADVDIAAGRDTQIDPVPGTYADADAARGDDKLPEAADPTLSGSDDAMGGTGGENAGGAG